MKTQYCCCWSELVNPTTMNQRTSSCFPFSVRAWCTLSCIGSISAAQFANTHWNHQACVHRYTTLFCWVNSTYVFLLRIRSSMVQICLFEQYCMKRYEEMNKHHEKGFLFLCVVSQKDIASLPNVINYSSSCGNMAGLGPTL